ncbi:MAG: outer membrane beta-barrel protein [Chitinophagaceae bacterium]|nr:outer membrane beta-barrel protein [Chitinophagaceae bacterium]
MKKIALVSIICFVASSLFAQDSVKIVPKKKPAIDLSGRANDHFLLQLGYTGWAGRPDTITPSGFSKSINVYFMFDFPFKTNPKLSMAFGPGISTDNIIFKEHFVGIRENSSVFQISDRSDTNHFRKTKLTTVYLEAPVEFRYTKDPLNPGKSLKFAIGVKVGTMLKAYTKSKDWQTKSDATINSYTQKEASKQYFNTTRLSAHARIGLGHFSLYGSYQITTLLKDGAGAEIRPYSIGITLSGL